MTLPKKKTNIDAPDGVKKRLSSSTKRLDGRDILNIDAYVPHFFSTINNALSWGASNIYRTKFGVGIVEWRVLSMLAIEPGITAFRVCEVLSVDKAAVSRALQNLQKLDYLKYEAPATDPRKRAWRLSDKGYALHDEILATALERERRLVSGVDPEELETFLKVARQMWENAKKPT